MEINKEYEEEYRLWINRLKNRGINVKKNKVITDAMISAHNDLVRARQHGQSCHLISHKDYKTINKISKKYNYFIGKIFDWE